jgi:hypothetical protein
MIVAMAPPHLGNEVLSARISLTRTNSQVYMTPRGVCCLLSCFPSSQLMPRSLYPFGFSRTGEEIKLDECP